VEELAGCWGHRGWIWIDTIVENLARLSESVLETVQWVSESAVSLEPAVVEPGVAEPSVTAGILSIALSGRSIDRCHRLAVPLPGRDGGKAVGRRIGRIGSIGRTGTGVADGDGVGVTGLTGGLSMIDGGGAGLAGVDDVGGLSAS
jgi:hypothetical protein